ncbi:exodeoxyribonuclease III [Gloeomargarita lithophora Alchichica-D10]|uniref:Exodeoxyribonuclease III n=1 Tax=Gloeomargarita lithophora Alchichica-D10 TaxID=1188229 RepID=A0A1J0AE32_9CYAN|nr:exodeoxyribonuclease III [Gloeomargarita lithophora]APB34206.1 exodeoxyribonuclease III [Gloeomargarita lithophora Alchichica-D10]
MQIATWNVNSIRMRLGHIQQWLEKNPVDVLCLQETKVMDEQFPQDAFPGYTCAIAGQKSYNGVAILSKIKPTAISVGFAPILGAEVIGDLDVQKRLIHIQIQSIEIINVYVPNGQSIGSEKYEYKLCWLRALYQYLSHFTSLKLPVCVCGDWNIAPTDLDIYNPENKQDHIMASPPERQAFEDFLSLNFQDSLRRFSQESEQFTWWDYRAGSFRRNHGWRIDHILISSWLHSRAKNCWIDREPRGWEQPSDHTPVILELDIENIAILLN